MKRRDFLDWLIASTSAVLGAFVAFPLVRYVVPPRIPEAVTRRVVAAKKDELAPGAYKTFPFGSKPGILIRLSDGSYRALSADCTHLSCTVQFRKADQSLWCACHDGVYDSEGRNVSGPPPRPLERFEVHEVGDEIVVEKARTA